MRIIHLQNFKSIIWSMLILSSISSYAQQSRYEVRLSEAFPSGNNYLSKYFVGQVSLGLDMELIDTGRWSAGISLDGTYFRFDRRLNLKYIDDRHSFLGQVGIYLSRDWGGLHTSVSSGVARQYYSDTELDVGPDRDDAYHMFGLFGSARVAVELHPRIFLFSDYTHIIFEQHREPDWHMSFDYPGPETYMSYFRVGLGYHF